MTEKKGSVVKGSYVLLIQLPEEQMIAVGNLQNIYFTNGCYAYVGSALGGFKSRINRHLRRNKRPHWHIDYLLQKASITGIVLYETNGRVECNIARALSRQFDSTPGFGSSDCKCQSHLFFAAEESMMEAKIVKNISLPGIKPRLWTDL